MTQQVVSARVILSSLSPLVDNASFSIEIEQQGTNTGLTYSTVATKIENFINVVGTGGSGALCKWIPTVYSRVANASTIEMYDITAHLNGSPAGSPVNITHFTLGAATTGANYGPEGCALLVSFRSDYGTDVEFAPGARPRSRDRNRFYIPVLVGCFTGEASTNRTIWTSQAATDFTASIQELFAYSGTSDVPVWVQWSRKNASVKNIASIWFEDCPRYQRRRPDPGNKLVVL
jgi:hypothetical protein